MEDSEEDQYWKERSEKLLGKAKGTNTTAGIDAFLNNLLTAAFRRPVEPSTLNEYIEIIMAEKTASGRLEDGYHLAIRTALTSPHFLYR